MNPRSLNFINGHAWPRSIHARLIETLKNDPPKALLFDIFFIEPFTSDPAGDRALVHATSGAPWVVHSISMFMDSRRRFRCLSPALAAAAHQMGTVNAFTDEDGVLRASQLEMPMEEMRIPLLSLLGVGLARGENPTMLAHEAPMRFSRRDAREFCRSRADVFDTYPYAGCSGRPRPAVDVCRKNRFGRLERHRDV